MNDSQLIERIKELEKKEIMLSNILSKSIELQAFVDDWDSGDSSRLPLNDNAKIHPVRRFLAFLSEEK